MGLCWNIVKKEKDMEYYSASLALLERILDRRAYLCLDSDSPGSDKNDAWTSDGAACVRWCCIGILKYL